MQIMVHDKIDNIRMAVPSGYGEILRLVWSIDNIRLTYLTIFYKATGLYRNLDIRD